MAGERWIFTKSQLVNTPSRKHGIDADKELTYRQLSASLIQDMGQRLTVTQLCINTALVYMHRFYIFQSFGRFPRQEMAPAFIFLAAKVEEQPRKLEHVIRAANSCLHRDAPDVKSEEYLEQAQTLVINENVLLQTLGFEVQVDHPHTHVVKTCQLVRASKDLAQTSYFLATNSLHLTTLCMQYKPTVVSCVCIHLACKWANWEIPRSSEGKEWYYYVDKNITLELLEDLTLEFLNILDKCPSKLKKKIMGWKGAGKELHIKELQKEEDGGAPPEKRQRMDHPPPSATETGKSAGTSGHHKPTNHDRKGESEKHGNTSLSLGTIKKETQQPQPIPAKSSQESHSESILSGSEASLTGDPQGAESETKKFKPDSMSVRAYLERKERERKHVRHESVQPVVIKQDPHSPNVTVKQEAVPSIVIKQESPDNYNQSALDRNYSNTAGERTDRKSKSVKEIPQSSHSEGQSLKKHIKLEKKEEIPSVKIHLKPVPSPSSQLVKQDSSSPLKLKISTAHLKDHEHRLSERSASSSKRGNDPLEAGMSTDKPRKSRSKDRHGHSKSRKGEEHQKSSQSSAHQKPQAPNASGTNGKLKLHIKMSDGQKGTYQSSLSNDAGGASSSHKRSHRHESSLQDDKHTRHKTRATTDIVTAGSQPEFNRDAEQHSHPWSLSDLVSQPTSDSNGSPRKRRRTPSSNEQKLEMGKLKRSSSSHSVVSMELSDTGSSGEHLLSPDISQHGLDSNRGSNANSPHPVASQQHLSQVHHQLQQLIELQKSNIARQMSQQSNSGGGSLFDLDAYCNPGTLPPLPDEPPPRPPSPPSNITPTPPF